MASTSAEREAIKTCERMDRQLRALQGSPDVQQTLLALIEINRVVRLWIEEMASRLRALEERCPR